MAEFLARHSALVLVVPAIVAIALVVWNLLPYVRRHPGKGTCVLALVCLVIHTAILLTREFALQTFPRDDFQGFWESAWSKLGLSLNAPAIFIASLLTEPYSPAIPGWFDSRFGRQHGYTVFLLVAGGLQWLLAGACVGLVTWWRQARARGRDAGNNRRAEL